MNRRGMLKALAGGAGLFASMRAGAMEMMFKDMQALDQLPYFVRNAAGKLALKAGVADRVIDFHTHIAMSFLACPRTDLEREDDEPKTFFPAHDNPVDLSTYAAQSFTEENAKTAQNESLKQAYTHRGFAGSQTPKNLVNMMDRYNVTKSIILPIDYPLGAASRNTQRYLQAAKKYPRLVTFASVHPNDPALERRVRKFKDEGCVGMKIHPPMQFVKANQKNCMKLTKLCGQLGMPCLFHAGASDIAPAFQNEYPQIKHFWEPVAAQPETIFILAHGGIHLYKELIDLAVKHENVWIELSGQPPAPIREMIDAGLEDRILFGSDWPYYDEAIPLAKTLIATEGMPEVRDKILYGNASRLLKTMGVEA